jgi:pimeloyl-ACP methyl ester carboxylesterase
MFMLEAFAAIEYGLFVTAAPLLTLGKEGDGHPVLVLPGFGASDRSTAPLRQFLRQKGYAVHGWQLGSNIGPHPHIVDRMERRLLALHRLHDRSVTLIGWSLGGIYARELARAHPGIVRAVIVLGSPFRFRNGDRSHASVLYDSLAPPDDPFPGRRIPERDRPPLPVPATSIYTRTDGIVSWRACIDRPGPRTENIEVVSTHSGLGVNLAVLYAVADRLALPEGRWAPFRPPFVLRQWYPTPSSWAETDSTAPVLV